jgi:hypothetical protein
MDVLEDGRPARSSDRGMYISQGLARQRWGTMAKIAGIFLLVGLARTEGKTLAHGPAISALDCLLAGLGYTVRLGGGARTRGETEPVLGCLCAAQAAIWLEW